MSGYRHDRAGGFAARHRTPARTGQQLRGDWVSAIGFCRGLDDPILGRTQADLILLLTASLRHLARDNFPIEAFSGRELASAFLTLARLFVTRDVAPEARTACAPVLRAAAEALDGLLVRLREAEAGAWQNRIGKD